MKKITIFAAVIAAMALASCGSQKKAVADDNYYNNPRHQQTKPVARDYDDPDGEEIKLTAAEEYALLDPARRACGKGSHFSEASAKQIAELEGRRAMADALSAVILAAAKRSAFDITQYAGDDESARTATDGGEKQNTLARSISENTISNAAVTKISKKYNKSNKKHTYYTCVEYVGSIEEMAKSVSEQIKNKIAPKDRKAIEKTLKEFEEEVAEELHGKK